MSTEQEQNTPHGGDDDRLTRMENTLSQLAGVLTRDREATQHELDAVTKKLETLIPAGRDSSGITTASVAADGDAGSDGEDDGEDDDPGFTGWADSADAQEWAGLVQWVDWLSATYELGDFGVRACWPAHGAAIEELAGLKMAWEHAIGACIEAEWVGAEALAYWHDRYLPGVTGRLRALYGMNACKRQHEKRPRPLVTDTSYVVIRSTGEVPDLAGSTR